MDNQIGTANISQATIAFGVSLDKATQLAGEPTHHIAISLNPVDIYAELRQLQAELVDAAQSAAALPAIETEVVSRARCRGLKRLEWVRRRPSS